MPFHDLDYRAASPAPALAPYVESFRMPRNPSTVAQPIVLVPDGRIDLFFSYSAAEPYHVTLLGLQDRPKAQVIAPYSTVFAISWNLLAVEYLLPLPLGTLRHSGCSLPLDYLGMSVADLQEFNGFCAKARPGSRRPCPVTWIRANAHYLPCCTPPMVTCRSMPWLRRWAGAADKSTATSPATSAFR